MLDGEIYSMWCIGITWRCTPYEAIGIWSTIIGYSSVVVVSVLHLMMLQSNENVSAGNAVSPRNDKSTQNINDDMGHLISLVVYFFIFAAGCLTWVINPHYVHPFQIWQIQLLGSTMLAICLALFVKVHVDMGDSWYPFPETPPELVTHGLFQYARHPMYAVVIWAAIATFLATLNWVIGWCVSGTVIMTLRRIKTEERILEDLFGERYIDYQRHVPALGRPWQFLGFDTQLRQNRENYNVIS